MRHRTFFINGKQGSADSLDSIVENNYNPWPQGKFHAPEKTNASTKSDSVTNLTTHMKMCSIGSTKKRSKKGKIVEPRRTAGVAPPLPPRPHDSGGGKPLGGNTSISMTTIARDKQQIRCCIIGDEAVGKTALIVSYLSNGYPETYTPTVHDCYTVHLTVEDEPISFQLYDTAGQEHFSVLRRLSYPDADVFMVCFSIIDPYSFKRVQTKWLKELAEYSPHTPIVLVGTKHDQRNNINTKLLLNKHGLKPITTEEGEHFASKIRAKQVII
jgi:small GTP-binding protein